MMKTRRTLVLIGTLGLLCSSAVFAHNSGAPVVNGGITVWGDSYGNVQYAGNLVVGAPYAYALVPDYRHAHGRACRHRSHYAYERGYYEGRHQRHGKSHKRRHKRGHGRHH